MKNHITRTIDEIWCAEIPLDKEKLKWSVAVMDCCRAVLASEIRETMDSALCVRTQQRL